MFSTRERARTVAMALVVLASALGLLAVLAGTARLSRAADTGPTCFGRQATITGSGTIIGTEEDDVIMGSSGDDTIAGLGGNDAEIIGDHRAANPNGASGDDALFGNAGNDGLHGDSFADGIESGNGEDSCDGGAQTDTAANCEDQIGIP